LSNQSAPGNQPDPNPIEQFRRLAEPLRQSLNDWVPVFTPIVASIALLLGAVGLPSTVTTQIAWIVVIAAALVGTYFLWRSQRSRSRVPRQAPQADLLSSRARTAFRGLAGFQVGDQLPGEQRRREARTIFTQIADDNFNFGILSGDTGAGKSSLARAELTKILQAEGYRVVLLPSPRQVFSKSEIEDSTITSAIKTMLDWGGDHKLASGSGPGILLIDQFEEFFIQFRKTSERQRIAKLLRTFIEDNKTKLLCVIRRDYYLDFHDFSPEIIEPTSARNTFNLKNFEVAEAANVIVECAGADGISISETVAQEIAKDLADKGEVRPAELQIVCTALRGNFEIENYRRQGGAANILSHHVSQAIENSGDPKMARLILRALCDFPGNAKSQPYETEQLTSLVDKVERSNESVEIVVLRILKRFVDERLISHGLREGSREIWSLIHDYLVEPIKIATQDASTRIEDATRALETYIRERRSNKRALIPLGKLGEIQHYAPAALLKSPEAKQLIRRSYAVGYGRPAAMVVAAVVATVGIVGLASLESVWISGPDDDHRSSVRGSDYQASTLGKGNVVVMAGSEFRTAPEASFWRADTGERLHTLSGEAMFYSNHYLVDVRKSEKIARVWNLTNIMTADDLKNLDTTSIDIPISLEDDRGFHQYTIQGHRLIVEANQAWRVYDLTDKNAAPAIIDYVTVDSRGFRPLIIRLGDRDVVGAVRRESNGYVFAISGISDEFPIKGKLISVATFDKRNSKNNEANDLFLIVSVDDSKVNFSIYGLENGNITLRRERAIPDNDKSMSYWYTPVGNIIYNTALGSSDVFNVYRSSDLETLDQRGKNDKWSKVIWPRETRGFPAFENSDNELRAWTEDGIEKRVNIGANFDRDDYITATKDLGLIVIYHAENLNIDIFNISDATEVRVSSGEATNVSFEADDGEIVVSTPTASVRLVSNDGRKLGEILGIDGGVSLITRQYCAANIWTDRGQVLKVFRKWRAFGFLKFGHGGCQDALNLGK
jgi:hypothetical protein